MRGLMLMVAAGVLGLMLGGQAEAARWTYPGDIASHLANGHGVSAAGMTREQAEALHDQLHESGRGGAALSARITRDSPRWRVNARRPVTANGVRGWIFPRVFVRRR